MNFERSRWRYLAPALVAFLLGVAVMLIQGTYVLYHGDPGDIWYYGFEMGSVARSLVHGFGYASPFAPFMGQTGPTAWVPPLYPLLIAGVAKLFGDFSATTVLVLMVLNCAFTALTCIPIYLIAEKTLGPRTAWLAAWLWALAPYFNRWHKWIWEVNLSALLLTAMFWFVLRVAQGRRRRDEVALAVLAGLAALGNPALLSFVPAALIWIYWQRRRDESGLRATMLQALRPVLIVCSVVTLMVAPWIVRNRMAFGQWVFLRSNFGAEFYLSNQHALAPVDWLRRHPGFNWDEGNAYRVMRELPYNRDRLARALAYIREYPSEFEAVSFSRVIMFWSGGLPTGFNSGDPFWRYVAYVPLSLLGIAGLMIVFFGHLPGRWMYAAIVALYPLIYYITYPLTRNRHAIEPILLVLACYPISLLVSRISPSLPSAGRSAIARLGGAAVALLVVVCAVLGAYRAARRPMPAFAAPPTIVPGRFIQVCGQPDQLTRNRDFVDLEYNKVRLHFRIVGNKQGWVFDAPTGDLLMSVRGLGCWKRATGE